MEYQEIQEDDPITSKEAQEAQLSAAILLAVDMESAFKLFSYRIIDQQAYFERVDTLISLYQAKKLSNGGN